MSLDNQHLPGGDMSGLVAEAVEYMVDAGQRSVLFLDIITRHRSTSFNSLSRCLQLSQSPVPPPWQPNEHFVGR
jgi:hypothetical protein